MGVHKAIETPERMWELFQSYRQEAKRDVYLVQDYVGKDAERVYREKERPLTYEGFCNFLEDQGVIINPIHYFMNHEGRYEAFVTICSRIKRVIRQDQIEGGMVGIYNPSITQRLNNLVDRTDMTTQGEKVGAVDVSKFTDEDLIKLAELQKKACGE
jgi:hypothetical protein